MGLLELDQKNYKTATRAFDRAIEINPDFAIAYYNRAIAYRYN
jgi:lipoprotein NlpI